MTDKKPDAADRVPRPNPKPADAAKGPKQDAPNYEDTKDGGRALPAGEVNSANDE
jgi:hypothetical protein